MAAVFRRHSERLHFRVAATLLDYNMKPYLDMSSVDVHFFRVREARESMDIFLDIHIQRPRELERHRIGLFMITGRGLHSLDGTRIKPICMERLRERGLTILQYMQNYVRTTVDFHLFRAKEARDALETPRDVTQMDLYSQKAEVYRAMADDYFRSNIRCLESGDNKKAALFRRHSEHLHFRAAATLLEYNMQNYPDMSTVDFHFFRVREARETMDIFLDIHIRKLRESERHRIGLFIITGRGLHSLDGPRIKPACVERLRERGLTSAEVYQNPGMLFTYVTSRAKLTCELLANDHVT